MHRLLRVTSDISCACCLISYRVLKLIMVVGVVGNAGKGLGEIVDYSGVLNG